MEYPKGHRERNEKPKNEKTLQQTEQKTKFDGILFSMQVKWKLLGKVPECWCEGCF